MTLLVFTACPSRSVAQKLAQKIVSKKLAACAQISGAIESHYVWKGRLTKAKEFSICFKTTAKNYKRLERALLEDHPYEVPEILALKAPSVLPAYLRWIASNVA
jgi:periplasmic divalent cation tolerance protein